MSELDVLANIMRHIAFDPNGCWVSTFAKARGGYGVIKYRGRNRPVHRIAYELIEGPIPAGLVIDHLCRQRACCNPRHLEPVTPAENTRRGHGPCAINFRKTHCPQGHALSEGNLASYPSWGRACLTCKRDRERIRRSRFPELVREQQQRHSAKRRRSQKEKNVG